MKHKSNEATFKDPVCGMEVSRMTAPYEYEYKGKTYYFCAGICQQAFEEEPDRYTHLHRQHGIKTR